MVLARIILTVVLSLAAIPALSQSRHALVVGIDAYQSIPTLQKAVNDARAMAEVLHEIGFSVALHVDADEATLLSAISDLSGRVQPGDEVLIFFAGHGIEVEGQNYLLPVDVPALGPGQELIIRRRSIPVADIVDSLDRRQAGVSLLILDACRNNPFPRQGTRSLGGSRGLAALVDPPIGTYIAYSAGAGQEALDRLSDADPDPNSVFTRTLLPRLREPGQDFNAIMTEVRSEVRRLARSVNHIQFPAVYNQLDGSYFLLPPVPSAQPAAPAPLPVDPCTVARADWDRLGENPSAPLVEQFRMAHPACPLMVAVATERLAALQAPAPTAPQAALPAPLVIAAIPDATAERAPFMVPLLQQVPTTDLYLQVQTELNRVGCNAGTPDGIWGARSTRALETYRRVTRSTARDLPVDWRLLAELRASPSRVCPVECQPGSNLVGGVCVDRPQQAGLPQTEGGTSNRASIEGHWVSSTNRAFS
jgi:hypothetical protein